MPSADLVRLATAPAPPLVVPDPTGRRLLVLSRPALPPVASLVESGARRGRCAAPPRYDAMALLDVAGGGARPVLTVPGAAIGFPAWSPDGARLAFWVERDGRREVQVVSSGTPVSTGLVAGGCAAVPLRWLADGRRVLVVAEAEHGASAVVLLDAVDGRRRRIGEPGRVVAAAASPDGRFALVERRGPDGPAVEILRLDTGAPVVRLPAGGVRTGYRRAWQWQPSAPAALAWLERGGGEPDRLMVWRAPFAAEPTAVFRSPAAITGIVWLGGNGMWVNVHDRARGRSSVWLAGTASGTGPRLLRESAVDDGGTAPDRPLARPHFTGATVSAGGSATYLPGSTVGRNGPRAHLDRVDLATGALVRVWQADEGTESRVVAVLSPDAGRLLVRSTRFGAPPVWIEVDVATGAHRALLPATASGAGVPRHATRLIRYRRADGAALWGLLHLPADREPGVRLPLVITGYPRNFPDAASAGVVRGSPYRFRRLDRSPYLALLARGFAVLEASMPVIGAGGTGNDTFIEQVTASARAGIDAVVEMGVADPHRVGVVGHSYGAFLAANLLAHSDLFAAGVAMSGAYDRRLTPNGFQTERRTLGEARDTYLRVSPVLHADGIRAPLLLVHGAEDRTATRPEQSRRLFDAIEASGGTAGLMLLPGEGHRYRGRESVLHVMASMIDWFDRYLR